MGLACGVGISTEYPVHFPKGSECSSLGQGPSEAPQSHLEGVCVVEAIHQPEAASAGHFRSREDPVYQDGARTKQTNLEVLSLCAILPADFQEVF